MLRGARHQILEFEESLLARALQVERFACQVFTLNKDTRKDGIAACAHLSKARTCS